jgi:hypothetical protein
MYGHDVIILTLYQFNTSFNTNGHIYIYIYIYIIPISYKPKVDLEAHIMTNRLV